MKFFDQDFWDMFIDPEGGELFKRLRSFGIKFVDNSKNLERKGAGFANFTCKYPPPPLLHFLCGRAGSIIL
ncbi:hypothetical protein D3C87_1868890 [compost metagenome]